MSARLSLLAEALPQPHSHVRETESPGQGVKAFFILFAPQSRASGGTGGHLSKHLVTGGLDVGACVLFAAPPFPHLLSRIVIRPPCPTSS